MAKDSYYAKDIGDTLRLKVRKVDTRLLSKIMRSPKAIAEQPAEVITDIGKYMVVSKWSPQEQAVYSAVLDGTSSVSELVWGTGFTSREIDKALKELQKKGYVGVQKELSPSL